MKSKAREFSSASNIDIVAGNILGPCVVPRYWVVLQSLQAAAIGFTAALLMQAEQPKRALRVVLDALELAQVTATAHGH
eukprot:734446-Amphidinium_carterae.1